MHMHMPPPHMLPEPASRALAAARTSIVPACPPRAAARKAAFRARPAAPRTPSGQQPRTPPTAVRACPRAAR
jgi:hypothetical protein